MRPVSAIVEVTAPVLKREVLSRLTKDPACEELHQRIQSMALVKGITEEHLLDEHVHTCNFFAFHANSAR